MSWTDLGQPSFDEIFDVVLGIDGRNLYAAGSASGASASSEASNEPLRRQDGQTVPV